MMTAWLLRSWSGVACDVVRDVALGGSVGVTGAVTGWYMQE